MKQIIVSLSVLMLLALIAGNAIAQPLPPAANMPNPYAQQYNFNPGAWGQGMGPGWFQGAGPGWGGGPGMMQPGMGPGMRQGMWPQGGQGMRQGMRQPGMMRPGMRQGMKPQSGQGMRQKQPEMLADLAKLLGRVEVSAETERIWTKLGELQQTQHSLIWDLMVLRSAETPDRALITAKSKELAENRKQLAAARKELAKHIEPAGKRDTRADQTKPAKPKAGKPKALKPQGEQL